MSDLVYKFPNNKFLITNKRNNVINIFEERKLMEKFFRSYKIDIECKNVYIGINSITYVIDLKCKIRVAKIKSYKEDLMLNFNAKDVEFQVAINGTEYLGIHLIKEMKNVLLLGNLINSLEFIKSNQKVPIIIGMDYKNNIIIEDLSEFPHLLVAGTTGTGKSNLLSTFILEIIYKSTPEEVKLVLIDTIGTNFKRFNILPHLLIPVIEQRGMLSEIFKQLIQEMNFRYNVFEKANVEDIDSYNEIAVKKLPRIIVFIEDFYDLIIHEEKEIEITIQQLTQMSKIVGINLIISTQRSSSNVITEIIKANISSRIAFKVSTQNESKTIIDISGAEELFIYGDILFEKTSELKIKRLQTAYISDREIENILNDVKENNN